MEYGIVWEFLSKTKLVNTLQEQFFPIRGAELLKALLCEQMCDMCFVV